VRLLTKKFTPDPVFVRLVNLFTHPISGTETMLRQRILLAALCVLAVACQRGVAADPPPQERVTLMTMLNQWQYPDAEFHGAQGSDAAVTGISSIKCHAVLTTPDAVEKVVAFYQQKLNVDSSGTNLGQKDGERITTSRAISIQNDSADRPLKLTIISINEKNMSTTLVISRSEGEAATHIAWSNFRQLSP
jgi:hypothetical protein